MPKFISISTFGDLYSSQADLLTEEGLQGFFAKLKGAEGALICRANGIERWELESFITSLENPSNVLFYGWIAHTKPLENLLNRGKRVQPFIDDNKHLEHQLAGQYQRFVSPFLAESLLRSGDVDDLEKLVNLMSYTCLLDTDNRAMVEEQLFKPIGVLLKRLKDQAPLLQEEQSLIDMVKPICSKEIIQTVNYLSKSSYRLKLEYVDTVLEIIRYPACTPRFANWLLKQMDLIKLNQEHNDKLKDLRKELREGSLEVSEKTSNGKLVIPWRFITVFLGLAGIFIFVMFAVSNNWFNEVHTPELSDNTSFKQFTKEERMKIDSLLREMNGSFLDDNDRLDQGIPFLGGGSATLTLRKAFDNPVMERVYSDLNKDADLQNAGYSDTCTRKAQFNQLSGVEDLSLKYGNVEVMIRNESEYDVIIYVSDDYNGGGVYSMYLEKGEIEVFQMDIGNTILAVPGANYQKYYPPNADPSELPSQKYKRHFCDTDMNYSDAINTAYVLVDGNGGKTKFMLAGDPSSFFDIVDIYGVLEIM